MHTELTVSDIKRAVKILKESALPIKVIETQEQADEANLLWEMLGLNLEKIKIGDEVIELEMHPSIYQLILNEE